MMISDERIKEVFRESQMYREIEKYFDTDCMPDFENDFVNAVKQCFDEDKALEE